MEPQSPFDSSSEPALEASTLTASPFAHDPEPRLGIIHLMGWIGCTAIFLGVQQLLSNFSSSADFPESPGYYVMRVAWGIGGGIAAGSLFMLAIRRWRHIPFPVHPGEFLLVLQGCTILVTLVVWGAFASAGMVEEPVIFLLVLFLSQTAVTVIFAIWTWRAFAHRRWRAYFVSFAVLSTWQAAVQLGVLFVSETLTTSTLSCVTLALPLLLAFAIFGDHRTGARRPWTHWLGIALQIWFWFSEWILPRLVR